ncbi:hypothetical protein FISHEDRAFT_62337 [Fistulina hepatica ATCC 64428]|nr:hypothetical protein FISHEDRAFT_62337 [Fistulina hepatica ATCC 64428]
MQSKRQVSPLAIMLPRPSLPSRCSSGYSSSSSSSSPRTPRRIVESPTCSFFTANRKSTDSWNSSNQDEEEWEWTPQQLTLLLRAIDALPQHVLTPFGPVPPAQILDKLARRVAAAKGPEDWPHSVRATRVKLMELSRARAAEEALLEKNGEVIREEPEDAVEIRDGTELSDDDLFQPTDKLNKTVGVNRRRRPAYRQSSMDFLNMPGVANAHDSTTIERTSSSALSTGSVPAPRGIKRAPSFGVTAQEIRQNAKVPNRKASDGETSLTNTCPSSDEEEKQRSSRAKKTKTKAVGTEPGSGVVVKATSGAKVRQPSQAPLQPSSTGKRRIRPMNLERNPSILGGLLPNISPEPSKPGVFRSSGRLQRPAQRQEDVPTAPGSPLLPQESPQCLLAALVQHSFGLSGERVPQSPAMP